MNLYLWYILTLTLVLVSVTAVLCKIRNDLKKNSDIRSLVTGIVIIPKNNNNTEFMFYKFRMVYKSNNADKTI